MVRAELGVVRESQKTVCTDGKIHHAAPGPPAAPPEGLPLPLRCSKACHYVFFIFAHGPLRYRRCPGPSQICTETPRTMGEVENHTQPSNMQKYHKKQSSPMVRADIGAAPGRHRDAFKHTGPWAKSKITKYHKTFKRIIQIDFAHGPRRVRRRTGEPKRRLQRR